MSSSKLGRSCLVKLREAVLMANTRKSTMTQESSVPPQRKRGSKRKVFEGEEFSSTQGGYLPHELQCVLNALNLLLMPHMREVMAQGQINKVMAKHRRLNIDHAPIPEMKWPRMHMNFNVKEGLDLSDLKPGQKINFKLLVDGDNNYVIEEIEVIK